MKTRQRGVWAQQIRAKAAVEGLADLGASPSGIRPYASSARSTEGLPCSVVAVQDAAVLASRRYESKMPCWDVFRMRTQKFEL